MPRSTRAEMAALSALAIRWWGVTDAQNAPTSRTAYKCRVDGKVVYSDSPCLGGQKIDAEPTRVVDKLRGKSRTGNDVGQERFREALGEAIRPITGMGEKVRIALSPIQTVRQCER